MMKRFSSPSNGTGAKARRKGILCVLLIMVLLAVQIVPSVGEEAHLSHYDYDDFAERFSFPQNPPNTEILYYGFCVANLEEAKIDVNTLLEEFPLYCEVRDISERKNTALYYAPDQYVVYELADKSRLFFFSYDNSLVSADHMLPRCTPEDFGLITPGISTPYHVVNVDGNTVFNPFISWGPVSYHCLSDGTFRQVTYQQAWYQAWFSDAEFVVKEITVIPQEECLTQFYRYVSPDDMP